MLTMKYLLSKPRGRLLLATAFLLQFTCRSDLFGLSAASVGRASFTFYNEQIQITYSRDLLSRRLPAVTEQSLTTFYHLLERVEYEPLLQQLQEQQVELRLNDWLYYELVSTCAQKIYWNRSDNEQRLLTWFLIAKSGYHIRLAYQREKVFIFAKTRENIYEAPLIKEGDDTYVNLTGISSQESVRGGVYMLSYLPQPRGRNFSFSLQQLPRFSPERIEKDLTFTFRDSTIRLQVQIDRSVIQLMSSYPLIHEAEYIKAPMSGTLINSLVPQLSRYIEGMPPSEALSFLAVFTRSAFEYREDHAYFGRSKPMVADEVFYYPYSDCEDRSALFYGLVEELLQLPMIIIAYPQHLTIAVAVEGVQGDSIRFGGQQYYICDPTGPRNSGQIGKLPKELVGQRYEILNLSQ